MLSLIQLALFYSYGIPIFLINLRTTYILWTKRSQYSSSYYQIFFLCGCNDSMLYLANNYVIRLPSFESFYNLYYSNFNEFTYYPSIPMFFVVFCSYFTNFSSLLLSMNRLTAICFYWKHERIWKRFTPIFVLISVAGSVFFAIQGLGNKYKYILTPIQNVTFVLVLDDGSFKLWDNEKISGIVVFLFTVAGLIANFMTFVFWRKRKTIIPQRHHDYERRLIILTVVVYSLHLISFVFNTFKRNIFSNVIQIYLAYETVSDMISLIPNLAILLFSPAIRSQVLPMDFISKIGLVGSRLSASMSPNRTSVSVIQSFQSLNKAEEI